MGIVAFKINRNMGKEGELSRETKQDARQMETANSLRKIFNIHE